MKQLTICSKWRKDTNLQRDTPYTTIVHRDLWTNNIMFTTGNVFYFQRRTGTPLGVTNNCTKAFFDTENKF